MHAVEHVRVPYRRFSEDEQREIVFKDITTGEVAHKTLLDSAGVADYRSAIGYFARTLMQEHKISLITWPGTYFRQRAPRYAG